MHAPTEYCRTEIKICGDSRALSAVCAAVEYCAAHLPFSPDEIQELTAATESLLTLALPSLAADEKLAVSIEQHPNRLEIELVGPGAATGEWASLRKLEGIDQMDRESGAGFTRLKIVKFVPGAANPSAPHH